MQICNLYFRMSFVTRSRYDTYGRLLYYSGMPSTDDPYKNYKTLFRLGDEEVTNQVRFIVPEDPEALKLDKFMFVATLEAPSNYVPQNDWHSKLIKSFAIRILDCTPDNSRDFIEYPIISHYQRKLNLSTEAQETELFPMGIYDSRDVDGDKLTKTFLKTKPHVNLAQNRLRYGTEKWSGALTETPILKPLAGSTIVNPSVGLYKYDRQSFVYHVRSPIAHGLCRQPRVLPTSSRLQFEIVKHSSNMVYTRFHKYQKCRMMKADLEPLLDNWPFADDLELKTKTENHRVIGECNCTELAALGKELKIKQLKEGRFFNLVENEDDLKFLYDRTLNDKNKYEYWQPHSVEYECLRTEEADDPRYMYFWKYYEMNPDMPVNLTEHMLESVYCMPSKAEKPIAISSKRAKIPFLLSQFKIINLAAGLKSYTLNLNQGVLPHMIIISGMSYRRRQEAGFDKSITKTSLTESGFEIEEMVIYIDNREAFRSPWKTKMDHYLNYLIHNGRFNNKAIGGCVDFDEFCEENWIVPLKFDDRHRTHGLVTAKITFKDNLRFSWDAFVTKVYLEKLIMDGQKKGLLYNFFIILISKFRCVS